MEEFFLLEMLILFNGRSKIKIYIQSNLNFIKFVYIYWKIYKHIGHGLWNFRIIVFVLLFSRFSLMRTYHFCKKIKISVRLLWAIWCLGLFLYTVLIFYTHITGLLGMNWRSALEWFNQLTYSLTAMVSYICWTKDLE